MKTNNNKELFFNLVSKKPSNLVNELEDRVKNQDWRKESKIIAFKVLKTLKNRGLKQCDLADLMNVSPQQISKIVKGKENLTLATIVKLQDTLDISILDSYESKYTNNYSALYSNYKTEIDGIEEIHNGIS